MLTTKHVEELVNCDVQQAKEEMKNLFRIQRQIVLLQRRMNLPETETPHQVDEAQLRLKDLTAAAEHILAVNHLYDIQDESIFVNEDDDLRSKFFGDNLELTIPGERPEAYLPHLPLPKQPTEIIQVYNDDQFNIIDSNETSLQEQSQSNIENLESAASIDNMQTSSSFDNLRDEIRFSEVDSGAFIPQVTRTGRLAGVPPKRYHQTMYTFI